MKKSTSSLVSLTVLLLATLAGLAGVHRAVAAPAIVNVVETGGDGTVLAKWTGNSFTGIAPLGAYTVPPYGVLAKCFVDRNHAHTNASGTVLIPSYLLGNEYIMTRNDNRENAGFRLDVTVSQDVLVYMLIDNRVGDGANANPPFNPNPVTAWANMTWVGAAGFRPVTTGVNRTANATLPDEVGIDENADGTINNWYSVYSNSYPAGTFSLLQQGLTGNNMYSVVVRGIGPTAPPPAPTGLTAVSGDMQVSLTWTAASGASLYYVKRSPTAGGPYTTVGTTADSSFTDPGLANGVDYFYVVSGTNVLGEGPNSNEAVGHPNPVVTGIAATGGTGQVAVAWNAFAGAASYSVRRAGAVGGPYADVATGLADTSYLDTTVQSGRTYFYVVIADIIGAGPSGFPAPASATTAPGAPVLSATIFATTVIRLGWTTDPVVSQFNLEQSPDGVNFSPLATEPGSQLSHTNSGLALNTTYFYRVQAVNATGSSAYSAVASNTTPTFGINVNFAAGAGNSAGNPVAPTPPGYVQDIGDLFGDRGNGYSYGWTNAGGTNIVADGRYRRNAISPDLRYDTFLHLMKANVSNPAQSAIWEIDVPNGFYSVRIVAGDSDNADPNADRFQFNAEGVITPAFTPAAVPPLAHWGDFTLTVAVSDGRLTVTSGPSALNNKIAFIDIYAAVPVPPTIGTSPASQTVTENRPASFAVSLSAGSTPFAYQWYFNDNPIADGTNATYAIALAQLTNAGNYSVVVTNYGGAATSSVAVLTVTEDMTPPQLVSAGSVDGNSIGVCFDELVEAGTATDPFNYSVNSDAVAVSGVTLRPDGRTVLLTLGAGVPISGPFMVTAVGILDLTGREANAGGGTASGTVAGLTPLDVGAPTQVGSTFSCKDGEFDVLAGGADIWGTSDQGHVTLMSRSGDWDVRVRVQRITPANAASKAGLIARVSLDANSPEVYLSVNAPASIGGRDQGEAGLRTTAGGATAAWPGSAPYTPAGIPNAWQRLTRAGNTFTAYRSSDGVSWMQFAQVILPAPDPLLVGLGTTAHDNAVAPTLAEYRNLYFLPAPTIVTPPVSQTAPCHGNATFTVSATGLSEGGALRYQWRRNGTPIAGATNDTLTLNDVILANNGDAYTVVVSNGGGNTTSAPALLMVTDGVPPVVTCPANVTVECASPAGATASFSASATDNCDSSVSATCMPASGSMFPPGTNLVTCSSTDASGNSNGCSFAVIVRDTMPPAITCPGGLTAPCNGINGPQVIYSVTATDACDANPAINCTPPSGSSFPLGPSTVNCETRDASGNANTCSFTVTVTDPVLVSLAITLQSGTGVVSWPLTCTAYELQETASLSPPIAWAASGVTIQVVNGRFQTTVSAVAAKFLRLRRTDAQGLVAGFESSHAKTADAAYRQLYNLGAGALGPLLAVTLHSGNYSGEAYENPRSSRTVMTPPRLALAAIYLIDGILLGDPAPHYSPTLNGPLSSDPDTNLQQAIARYQQWWAIYQGQPLDQLRLAPSPLDGGAVSWNGPLLFDQQAPDVGNETGGSKTPKKGGCLRLSKKADNSDQSYGWIYAPGTEGGPAPYNCLAWAVNCYNDRWLDTPFTHTAVWEQILTDHGYKVADGPVDCAGQCPEGHGPKIKMVFMVKQGEQPDDCNWSHAMKQQADGNWTSKNGQNSVFTDIADCEKFLDKHYKPAKGQTRVVKCYCK